MAALEADERLVAVVDDVARQLVSTEHFGAGSIIKTPLLYPSGAAVVVEITQHGERFFVSDMGYARQEAEMYGVSGSFDRSAQALAERFGIRFDNQAFFIVEASRGQLAGAATIIANCSSEAVAIAAHKAAERRYENDGDLVYRRLTSVFSSEEVARDVEIVGSSTHRWPISAMVQIGKQQVLFDPVSGHHLSIVNTAAKFHDIARLDKPPRRVALVKDKAELGDLFNVLAQAGNVMEYTVPDDTIRRMAEAA